MVATRGPFPDQSFFHTQSSPLQMKLITTSIVVDRLKIGGSLARAGIKELVNKGLIRLVSYHSKLGIYTRATNVE